MNLSSINYQPQVTLNNSVQCNKRNQNFKGLEKSLTKHNFGLSKQGGLFLLATIPPISLSSCRDSGHTYSAKPASGTKSIRNFNTEAEFEKLLRPEHHPDYYALEKDYEVLASSYFRRGGCYGSQSDEFVDVINALKIFFNHNTLPSIKDNKVKMFIGGIGESQEPYSLLATVKSLIEGENISDVLDMYTVDLQSKPGKYTLFQQSFNDVYGEPEFVKSSFVTDDATKYGLKSYRTHRVTGDIYKYLLNTYNNPEKAKWQTRIQDALKEYPNEEFDIISVNNTLMYINDKNELTESVKNIYRALKPGGIFISDNRMNIYTEIFTPENSKEIYPGIFQKLVG